MKLSQLGELALLEQIRKSFYKKSKNIIVGIGDDAAVLKPLDKKLLLTTDMMVEGVHFDLGFITPYQLGFKLTSVNVSDIYAMGGKPFYLLLNIAVNKDTNTKFIDSLLDGVKNAINLYDTILIGGDISATNTGIALSATLVGYTKKDIKRSGANTGDRIYVTGFLGDSACGLELLKKIRKPVPIENIKYRIQNIVPPPLTPPARGGECFKIPSPSRGEGKGGGASIDPEFWTRYSKMGLSWNMVEPLLKRHLMPQARNPKKFAQYATSMIDVSDGLLIDLSRLCSESKVGARIYLENFPLSPALKKTAAYLGISPIKLALSGGEDYEMLFTAPATKKVKEIHIGEITEAERVIVDSSGRERPFSAKGYQHFRNQK